MEKELTAEQIIKLSEETFKMPELQNFIGEKELKQSTLNKIIKKAG